MTIGYVGLGNMGGALARRLQLRHPLHVYDLNAAAVGLLTEVGAKASASLHDLAAACDQILLCLPTSEHVRTALFGAHGLASGLRPGTVIIDQTSGDPTITRALAAELTKQDVSLIDAPVSGGMQGARDGTIAIMVGATEEQYAAVLPLLRAISANVFHAGPIGSGQVIKLANNLLSGAQRLLTFEAMTLAVKNGIAPQTACEILLAGGGRSAFMEKFMASHILQGDLFTGFTLGLMYKDVRLACALGTASEVPMLFGNLTKEIYQQVINALGQDKQLHTAAIYMDRLAGTQMVPADTQRA